MNLKCVTFDAAGTLVDVRWDPVKIALDAALAGGLLLDEQVAGETYGRLLQSRWGHFRELNLRRSEEVCDQFWLDLGREWLTRIGEDPNRAQELSDYGNAQVFSMDGGVFRLFEDALEALDIVESRGLRLAVISNWDVSLHRVLRMLGVHHRFETVVASLEEGVEKPDARLFQLTLDRLGLTPENCLHVGDDPVADVHGAREVGLKALLIDRAATPGNGTITSLRDLAQYL